MEKVNIAVAGVTGMVGKSFLSILEERNFPVGNFYGFASSRSAGTSVKLFGKDYVVEELSEANIKNKRIDYALFSAGGDVSKKFAPVFAENGTVVIDNSSAWRMDENVPLVVPEVNGETAFNAKIIANPNCSTIQSVVALAPLHGKYKLKRVVYATYQSVSGAKTAGWQDLENGLKGRPPGSFPHPIAGNCLPHIDSFMENGYTKEEWKMIEETQKILGDYSVKVTATCVRVPVFIGHSVAVTAEFENSFELEEIKELLKHAEGITVMDDDANNNYPTPIFSADKDDVFIGRIRRDFTVENGLNMWVVSDNLRKGAALNTIQIAEYLIKNKK